MGGRSKRIGACLLALVAYALGAAVIAWLVYHNGAYPSGSDAMAHVYKGDVLYRDILAGTWWPFLDAMWYNGVEIMRYWAPLPVYVLAACQALAGGSPFYGYILLCALIFFAGGAAWYFVGAKLGRRALGAFIGALWFFMPNNLLALFYEGNLPRSIALVMLPVLVWCVWDFLRGGSWKQVPCIAVLFALIALCHSGYAGMIALALAVYLVCDAIANRRWKRGLAALLSVLCGFALIGVWLVPSLIGGITSTSSAEVMQTFFQSLWKSIDPFERIVTGGFDFYFGFAAFLLCVFGSVCAKRSTVPLFWAALVILLLTSTAAQPLLSALPGGQYLWMLRFISIALAFALLALLTWKTLRRGLLVAFCILLVADAVPSLPLLVGDMSGSQPEERYSLEQESTLIGYAQSITTQRLSVIDGSTLGSAAAFIVADFGDPVAESQGAGWQSAATASNIRQLNAAAEAGDFAYLFDRSLEMGDDTVLIRTSFVKNYTFESQLEMDAAAEACGYSFAVSNGDYRLYQLTDAPETWGTQTVYDAIGIGTATPALALSHPAMEETSDTNLNHYTFEQLSQYKTVYLDGFTYDDQQAAEDLVVRLSEAGVRVVIGADGMPVNKNSHDRIFLGVRANTVEFSNGYPELDTVAGKLHLQNFPAGYEDWNTVYLEGLDNVQGTFSISSGEDQQSYDLAFIGTAKNDNIVFVGLNLGYYYSLTEDAAAGELLDDALQIMDGDLPERTVVPVTVDYEADAITITSAYDGVNTSIAYHDEFEGDGAQDQNNLVVVDSGTTVLTFEYPYLARGIAVSAAGFAAIIALTLVVRRQQDAAVSPPQGQPVEGDAQ